MSISEALSRLKNDERNGRVVLWLDQKESYVSAMFGVLEEDGCCVVKGAFDIDWLRAGVGASDAGRVGWFHLPGFVNGEPGLLLGLERGCWVGTVLTVAVELPSTGSLLGASSCMREPLRRAVGESGKDFALFPSDLASALTERWVSPASCFRSCDAFADSLPEDEVGALICPGSGL